MSTSTLTRIAPQNPAEADASTRATLEGIQQKLGKIPNLFATFARSPAVLAAYLAFSEALAGGRLTPRQREILALAIGQANACQYCLSAHTAIGRSAGLSTEEIADARSGRADDALERALAALAVRLVLQRGVITDTELAEARAAGVGDDLLVEVVAHVALNTLTNYTNHVAGTAIDFPLVPLSPG